MKQMDTHVPSTNHQNACRACAHRCACEHFAESRTKKEKKKETQLCRVSQPSHLMRVSGRLTLCGGFITHQLPFFAASDSLTRVGWVAFAGKGELGLKRVLKPMQFLAPQHNCVSHSIQSRKVLELVKSLGPVLTWLRRWTDPNPPLILGA